MPWYADILNPYTISIQQNKKSLPSSELLSLEGPSESFSRVLTLAIGERSLPSLSLTTDWRKITSAELLLIDAHHPAKMAQSFRTEFMQIPVVTRVYVTACVLTTLAVVSMSLCSHRACQICVLSFTATECGDSTSTALPSRASQRRRGEWSS